jgi:ribosomal protein L11 methyltransferase
VRTWTKLTAHLEAIPDDWSVWTERFSQFGLDGTVQTDDPPTLSAFLPPQDSASQVKQHLEEHGARVTTEQVEEVDWSLAWRDYFKPIEVGERLWIRPSWEDAVVPPCRVEIVLDPGEAFGTGDHPTTRLCLRLLEKSVASGYLVADIGCGSGILSIAAKKLGAASVDAVDTDPLSIESTRKNAEANDVSVQTFLGAGFDPLSEQTYDVVVSNIISAAVIGLAREAAARVKPGGAWIVSGIIGPNWPDVFDEVSRVGFRVEHFEEDGDWVAATLRH